ncbi:WhiB family transcriptional regulator [Egibacter rhizosphaerae]|uniref:Transcriptional regulator WhiB n=1 Tax=Egibacter rhizosphaerae TaxID=1670831 RepID=A0A411YAL6_9ACTN|nr:WhiB family transcriptional regulator [Egibacter rhizosphaerae]QBI18219.1 WhiB family transcriptional regulator [Egibacter rhizosphaerae]
MRNAASPSDTRSDRHEHPAAGHSVSTLPEDDTWVAQAACRDASPDLFFSDRAEDIRAAVRICRRCPVVEPCRAVALASGERFGVWGGQTERQRRRELRQAAEQPDAA